MLAHQRGFYIDVLPNDHNKGTLDLCDEGTHDKSKRVIDYKFPFPVVVSKLLEYFEVDVNDELTKTIKVGSEIDFSTLEDQQCMD